MIAIDESLQQAMAARASWSHRRAYDVASALARRLGSVIDWDAGAGEEWMRILNGTRLEALISVKIPFAFIEARIGREKWPEESLEVVAVDGFDNAQFSCDLKTLNEAFGVTGRFGLLAPAGFSANDIWYATV